MFKLSYNEKGNYIKQKKGYIEYVFDNNNVYLKIENKRYPVIESLQKDNIKYLFEKLDLGIVQNRKLIKEQFYFGLKPKTKHKNIIIENNVLISDLENKNFKLDKEYICSYYFANKYQKYKKIIFKNINGFVCIKYKNIENLYLLNEIEYQHSYFPKKNEKEKIIYKEI